MTGAPLFRWFILRRLRQEPLRVVLTVAGIALGVAVVIGIRLANVSSVEGFRAGVEALAGAATLEIRGAGAIDERVVADLVWLRRFGAVAPVIEADAILEVGSRREPIHVLGIDILRDRAIREYTLTDGTRRAPGLLETLQLLTAPDAILVPAAVAARHGLQVGDSVELVAGAVRRRFRIAALLSGGPGRSQPMPSVAVMDIGTAQWVFDRLGWIDRLEIRLDEDLDVDEAEQSIADRLPDGLRVSRPSRRGDEAERMLRAFQFNVTALSYVALLVGVFLIYNTVVTSVVSRREELGVLRALGTGRRAVMGLFLGEAAVLAAAATLAGLAAGAVLAHAAVRLTGATVNALYVAAEPRVPLPGGRDVWLAAALGLGLSILAAAAPALEASRVPPLAAIRWGALLESNQRRTAGFTALAFVLHAAAGVLAQLGPVNGLPVFGFAAAVAVVFGTAFLAPAMLASASAVLRTPLRRLFGVAGLLADASIAAGLRRLSVSTAALSASVAMLVAIAIMIGSFRETVIYWLNQTLRADLYISAGGRPGPSTLPVTVPAGVESLVRSHPAVASVERFRTMTVTYDGDPIVVSAADFEVIRTRRTMLFKTPADAAEVLVGSAAGRVLVSEPFAVRHDLEPGERIVLETAAGSREFTVAAVYYDYTTDRGVVLMDWSEFREAFGELRPTGLSVFLRPGTSPEAVREELAAVAADRYRVFMHTSRTLREQALRTFDNTFAVAYALEAIAIAVAMFGVAATLITLIAERSRELSMLRLVGAARGQMRRMVLIEAFVVALVSQVLGLAAGLALAVLLVDVINLHSFGWTIRYDLPVRFLLQASAALFLSALAAAMYPAQLAAAARPLMRERE
ncbi:MAG TPA: FtsX-like permease family protein [Vicinamibacterales bacterium]|nr:FtsX-like permease family protein [Vicinamibacterales bacterium]